MTKFSLAELADNANVSVTITAAELKDFFTVIVKQHDEENRARVENEKDAEKFLSAKETAQRLHCSLPTLWRWNKIGYLCPLKVGGKVHYRMLDVKKLEGKSL